MSTPSEAKRNAQRAYKDEAITEGLTAFQKLTALVYGTPQYFWYQKNIHMPFTSASSKERYSQHYHGKVVTLDQAEAIVTIDRDIPYHDLEQVIPYEMARKFVLNAPADVVAVECLCRRVIDRECQPSQVCMVIGKPFTDLVMAAHPKTSRRLSQEEALEMLREEHERRHMHTAYFKDVMLNRFYVICNCCKDHCLGIRMMTKYQAPFLSASGYSIKIDSEACNSCGKCVDVCPFGAIMSEGRTVLFDAAKCLGCGVCVEACPKNARSLVRDESKGLPLDVREMQKEPMVKAVKS